MSAPINKSQLIEKIRRSRAEWEALIAPLDDEQLLQPGVSGEWSIKDIIAHISWYEGEMIALLQARALKGSELWELVTDERNAAIFERHKDRSLAEVRAEAERVFDQMMVLIASLAEEDLIDPSRFAEMPLEWQPWEVIASNTYEHYPDHVLEVRDWLEE